MERTDEETLRFERALALGTLLTLLAYKAWVAFPHKLGATLIGFFLEALLLWSCLRFALWLSGRSLVAARTLFLPALYILLLCSTAHAYYFESAAERRFSLLEVGPSGVLYFFTHVLPADGYAVFGAVLAATHGLAFALRRTRVPALFASSHALVALPLTGLGLAIVGRPPSPVVDAAADVWEKVSTPSVRPSQKSRYSPSALDHSPSPANLAALSSPFKKIVVLVMETETAAAFELESQLLPKETFVHSGRAHTHRYERYFPNNQDSRTGMLDMLSSRFVPYDAYTEAGRDSYMFLAQKSSLPGELHALGYETAFAVSQNEIELVVGDLPWQRTINLDDDAKLAAAKERGLLCFTPYEFEHSCEDRALLPDVFAFLDGHERAFLYQEFIWGHASEYNEASGKSNAEYYSSYVDALIEHLRERGTLDETLIVLTSDHGFRDTAMQNQLGVYRIPLWFYATRFEAQERHALYSHLDFKNLLHAERTLGALPPENPFIMIYGPTSASFVAVVTRELEFLLLKLRDQSAYVMRHARLDATGAQLGPGKDAQAPADFLRLFYDYKRVFDRR